MGVRAAESRLPTTLVKDRRDSLAIDPLKKPDPVALTTELPHSLVGAAFSGRDWVDGRGWKAAPTFRNSSIGEVPP